MSRHPLNAMPRSAAMTIDPLLMDRLRALHETYTPWQKLLADTRKDTLRMAHEKAAFLPDHLRYTGPDPSREWTVVVPEWMRDQRNQMTGNADSAELVVKLMNSGSPGVMLDLEDSMANGWEQTEAGIRHCIAALHGELTYDKGGKTIGITPSATVTFVRPRGLHMSQHGVFREPMSASLFDVASVILQLDPKRLSHPPCIYIPKSERFEEARWWDGLFKELAKLMDQPPDWIKCMALVESHPLAYVMEEFAGRLSDHLCGLNLGRWDYMASLAHWNLNDPAWVLPDRDTIPSDVEFFQRLRYLLVETCHRHGLLAIGGMTALFPDRTDAALNRIALKALEADKRNEASVGMDGAWTGHPDQNEVAVAQFPAPNQLDVRHPRVTWPDLRPAPKGVGMISEDGTRRAVRATVEYRAGILKGKGASLIRRPSDNAPVMEDLATDRIFRLMIAQRIRHGHVTPSAVRAMYEEAILDLGDDPIWREAAYQSFDMIMDQDFDPS